MNTPNEITVEKMFNGVPKRHYEPLKIDFEIPPILQEYIDNFIDDLNNHNAHLEDCYRCEIRSILNGCDLCLTEEQVELLRNYYQRGGIYE